MIKRILTSLGDFAKNNNALKLSIELALQHNGHITGLTPLSLEEDEDLGPIPLSTRVLGGSSYSPDRSEFIKSTTKFQNFFNDECKANHLSHEIIRFNNQQNISIAQIISSHDVFVLGQDPDFFTSLADDFFHILNPLLIKTSRPVLIARNTTLTSGDVLIAFDGSPSSSRAIQIAFLLGFYKNKKVQLITVNNSESAARDNLKWIEILLQSHDIDYEAFPLISKTPPSQVILDFISQYETNLIITGISGKTRLDDFLGESVSRELVESAIAPSIFLYS